MKLTKIYYFSIIATIQADILNPKAGKLLEDLAALKLISIQKVSGNVFLTLINKFRTKEKKISFIARYYQRSR